MAGGNGPKKNRAKTKAEEEEEKKRLARAKKRANLLKSKGRKGVR